MTLGARHRPDGREEGSALVLALVFVTIIALGISALLSFADTSFRASRAVARQRDLVYAADGGMDALIRKIEAEKTCSDIYNAPPTASGVEVKVDCQPPLKPNVHNQFINPARAYDIGESPVALTADATMASRAAKTASITLTGYGSSPAGPVATVTLVVSHRDTGAIKSLEAKVRSADGSATTVEGSEHGSDCPGGGLCIRDELHEDRIPVSGLTTLANVTVSYTATLADPDGSKATESLDGIWLEVSGGGLPNPTTLKPTGHNQFESPTNAFQIESSAVVPAYATAGLGSTAATSASIVLSGYSRLTIPQDASIEEAVLRVTHGDSPSSDVKELKLTLETAPRTGASVSDAPIVISSTASPCGICIRSTPGEDRIDLKTAGNLNDPAQFKSIRISYDVTLADGVNKSVSERLDGIQIDLSYAPEGVPPADPRTKPKQAVLSLGTGASGEEGVRQGPTLASVVRGGVSSNSTVNVDPAGSLVVQGDVTAAGNCTGTIKASRSVRCANRSEGTPGGLAGGADPNYPAALSEMPSRQAVPPCSGEWLVTLTPGYYDDAAALSALTGPGCAGVKVVLLEPGAYYFNFNFAGRSADPAAAPCDPAACTWTISGNDVKVVGGKPRRWVADATKPKPDIALPGGCDTDQDGVQLVFGGESRLDVSGGKTELCPPLAVGPDGQRVAIYGLKTTRISERATLAPTGHDQFTGPANALALDNQTADARLTSTGATTAAIEVSGFPAPSLLPIEGITAATLLVAHRDVGDVSNLKATVSTAAGSTAINSGPAPGCSLCVHGSLTTDRIPLDLAATGLSNPAAFASLRVLYAASLQGGAERNATEGLDGVAIEVQRSIPLLGTLTQLPTAQNQFSAPENAFAFESPPKTANATLSTTGASAASITLSGFDQVAVPPLSTISSAKLTMAHTETSASDVTMTVSPATGSPTSRPLPTSTTRKADDVDLVALGVNSPAALAGLRITYAAKLAPGSTTATVALDGAAIAVTYEPPGPPDTAQLVGISHDQFVDPANAFHIEPVASALTATATLASGRAAASEITLNGFKPATAIPQTDPISRETLRVSRRDSGDVASVRAIVTRPGTPPSIFPLSLHTDLQEDRVDIGTGDAAGVTVRLEVTLAGGTRMNATEVLNGVAIDVVHGVVAVTDTFEPSGHDQFDPAAAAAVIDNNTAGASLSSAGATSASITLSGYNQLALSPDARIDSVTLRLAHRESTITDVASLTARVTGCTGARPVPVHSTLTEDRIDLKGCGLDAPAKLLGLAVTYEAKLAAGSGRGARVDLDGAMVEVRYREPRLERLTGCSVTAPYSGSGSGCAVLRASGSSLLAVHGTVYAPTAAVDVRLNGPSGTGVASVVLDRGVIARTAYLQIASAPTYRGPTIMVPDDKDNAQQTKIFTAYLEDNGVIRELLRAVVQFDPLKSPSVTVLSWSVLV